MAIEKVIPLLPNIKLLKKAEKYWIIDIWANLKCRFESPKIIFSSFKILVYGKWYSIASGLYILLFAINKKTIIELKITNFKKLREKYIFKFLKNINKGNINIKLLTTIFNGKKKFISRVIKEINIRP